MRPEEIEDRVISEFACRLLFRLQVYHLGVENSIKQGDYFKYYERVSTRTFSKAVSGMRSKPNPIGIGSGSDGYYFITRQSEYDSTYNWLNNKIKGAVSALRGIRKLRDITEEQLKLL